jgi:phage shock protein A
MAVDGGQNGGASGKGAQMAVLERVATLLRANLNDLLDRSEDPEKLVRQLLMDMNGQLIQVKTQVAAVMGNQRKLQRLWEENEAKAGQWQRKAQLAVEIGDDELAKQAPPSHRRDDAVS